MRAAWRIGINGLIGRRRRTLLLTAAVALACALVTAAACMLASIHAALGQRIEQTLGRGAVRISEVAGGRFETALLAQLESDPDVTLAAPRLKGSLRFPRAKSGRGFTLTAWGIDPEREAGVISPVFVEGRALRTDSEVVLNLAAAQELGASVGDQLRAQGAGPPMTLTVVGIEHGVVNDLVKRYSCRVSLATLRRAMPPAERRSLSEIVLVLREEADPAATAERLQQSAPAGVLVRTTTAVTSGVRDLMRAHKIGFVLAVAVAGLASSFIVLTGLTTGVIERQREMAIMRCLGARRATLAGAQAFTGLIVGAFGAALGAPLGVLLAWTIASVYADRLPAGLTVPPAGIALAALGAIIAGVLGAAWPALIAARASPITAMTRRATAPSIGAVVLCGAIGAALAIGHVGILTLPSDPEAIFYGHVTLGWEMMLTGYFLLAVPILALVARIAGPAVAALLRVPRALLCGSMTSTPLRHGFTAGALMLGLALMTDLWTVGSSMLRDWVGGFQFPDAFVQDLAGLSDEDERRLHSLDFVGATSGITLLRIDTNSFGVEGLVRAPAFFIAFEPEPFFAMTRLAWEAGDEAYARRRLAEGGAVVVAREFLIARGGMKVGDRFAFTHQGQRHEMEIVGAVSSPGLDLVGYAFDLGVEFGDAAVGAVFGSRADMQRIFGTDAVHLLQITYSRPLPDEVAADRIREALGRPTALVGSGREIKADIVEMGASTMRMASLVALAVMVMGSLGVSNVLLASIDARKFEFGVLRAVGASTGQTARLLIGEVILLCIAACIVGTGLGLHGSFTGARFQEVLLGIRIRVIPAVGPIAIGWGLLALITLGVVMPMIMRLARTRPRELLAATRG